MAACGAKAAAYLPGRGRLGCPAVRRVPSARGISLVEALAALLAVSFGMVAMVQLAGHLRQGADLARQRGDASQLAGRSLDAARVQARMSGASAAMSTRLTALPAAAEHTQAVQAGHSSYLVRQHAGPQTRKGNPDDAEDQPGTSAAPAMLQSLHVDTHWTDRTGELQALGFDTQVTAIDPGLAAFLRQAPQGSANRRPGARHAKIPVQAQDLDGQTSAFRPPGALHGLLWLFDRLSGDITAVCSHAKSHGELTTADVAKCRGNAFGYLLSGHVRFSSQSPPNPAAPSGMALPLTLRLTLTSSGHPIKPSYQCFDDAPVRPRPAQTTVTYFCIVHPNRSQPPFWSGRLDLAGLALRPGGVRVCRYSADHDGDGRISNGEHPASYHRVSAALVGQNFLVIPYQSDCPAGRSAHPANRPAAGTQTWPHQPPGHLPRLRLDPPTALLAGPPG